MDRQTMKRTTGPEYAFYDRISLLKQKIRKGTGTALASFLFWLLLLYCAYRVFWIIMLVVAFDDSDITSEQCRNAGIEAQRTAINPASDFSRLIHQQGDLKSFDEELGLHEPATVLQNSESPPFVTAIRSDQFLAIQGLIKQVHDVEFHPLDSKNRSAKLIIYDLGLTSQELVVLKRRCACVVKTMSDWNMSLELSAKMSHSSKAIIIQRTLHEYGGAVWLEPEARIRPRRLHMATVTARKRGYALWQRSERDTIIAYTHPKMFEFFGEQRCYFRNRRLIDPTAIILFNSPFIRTTIMKPWLKCVLNESCVAPWNSRIDGCFYERAPKYTGCHKFDVSALSIVVHFRLSPTDFRYSRVAYTAQSDEIEVRYFPEHPLSRKHRNYIIIAVVCVILIICSSNFWGPVLIACSGIKLKRIVAR